MNESNKRSLLVLLRLVVEAVGDNDRPEALVLRECPSLLEDPAPPGAPSGLGVSSSKVVTGAQAFMKPLEGLRRGILVIIEQPPLCGLIFYGPPIAIGPGLSLVTLIGGQDMRVGFMSY
ncbi:MAG TPA: hypothetical protein VE288_09495 [Rubrobacteraceae bacterium]|nr:hypothetical protein [Rubrobacteraceae bacterium]